MRRVFSSEGLFLAFLGWILGLPLGYVVYQVYVAAMAIGSAPRSTRSLIIGTFAA